MNPFQSTIDSPFTDDDDQEMIVEEQEKNSNLRTLAYCFSGDSVNAPSPRRTVAETSSAGQGKIKTRVPLARLAVYNDIEGDVVLNPLTQSVLMEDIANQGRSVTSQSASTSTSASASTSSLLSSRSSDSVLSDITYSSRVNSRESLDGAIRQIEQGQGQGQRQGRSQRQEQRQEQRRATNTEEKEGSDEYCQAAKEGALEMIQQLARARRLQLASMLTLLREQNKGRDWSAMGRSESKDSMFYRKLAYERLEEESYLIQVLLKDMFELEKLEQDPLTALEITLSFADRPGLKLSNRVPEDDDDFF
ncbi:MAG: hypothetical protein J3Q66DRAFT_330045 [Benniella sp.]|nr:MAG: hypothetical protein J3Q66DRAFT_330045 [Benniella sp.]